MSEQSGWIDGLVTRPVAVTMIFLAALVFGVVSYGRLPVELMPDLSYPTLTVRTAFTGAAPEEIEVQISRPVEEALATLEGLVRLESRSRAGTSDVVLGFDWGMNMAASVQAAREALQLVQLPEDADRPLILRFDPSLEPFLRLALSYDPEVLDLPPDRALMLLRRIADEELKPSLEGQRGVASVRVRGGFEREVRVAVREDWLKARRLRLDDVRAALAADNVNIAGGSVLEGDTEYLVRTLNEATTLDALRDLRIRRSDGTLVQLTEVATVEEAGRERTVMSRLDGAEAVELELFKEADANVVSVAQAVQAALKQSAITRALPPGVRLVELDDQAAFIDMAIRNLRDAVFLGGLLAVVVLFLFLRDLRATAIIGLAIPVSVVVAFAPLFLWGVSLNLMSLGGLALGVGMLVDNGVVVLEAIQRHVDAGLGRREAAVKGAGEVAAAVFASTLTTVAVFAPMTFVEGVGGQLFGDLALAVVGSLLASLAVALFLVPTLAAIGSPDAPVAAGETPALRARLAELRSSARAERDAIERPWVRRLWGWPRYLATVLTLGFGVLLWHGSLAIARGLLRVLRPPIRLALRLADHTASAFQRGFTRLAGRYDRILAAALRRSLWVVVFAGIAWVAGVQGLRSLGAELVPEVHQGRLLVDLTLPVGTPLATTARTSAAAEARVSAIPGVRTVYAVVGTDQRADSRPDEGEHTARLYLTLDPGPRMADREADAEQAVRDALRDLERVTVQLGRPSLFTFRAPLEVVVHGERLDALRQTGDRLVDALQASPGLSDVRTSLATGSPELEIRYDRERLARLDLDPAAVAQQLRDRIQGVRATAMPRDGQRVDVRVQLDEAERSSLDQLRRLNINPDVMPPIPLEAVATLIEGVGPSEIRRVDQRRAVVVSAAVAGFDLQSAIASLPAAVAEAGLDAGQYWRIGGQADELNDAMSSLAMALALAVFLVYVIMASTFEHLLHPLIILASLPLALTGVAAGLGLMDLPLSVVALIGLIVLAGVVVNNAIVLVDAVNRARAEGMATDAALLHAGHIRLRPILITTTTTVLGLLPLLLTSGPGAEIQAPLAVSVIGGLTSATLLTLVVIPAVYRLITPRVVAPDAAEAAAEPA